VSLGDVWPCEVLKSPGTMVDSTEHLIPFHKLSQWLTYSLIEPMMKISNITFQGIEHLTGLPEYRNGKNMLFLLKFRYKKFHLIKKFFYF